MISSQEHESGVRAEDEVASRRRNGDRRVTELMSWALLTAPVTMTCREARALAEARGVHHIPVLDGGVMVGMLCSCDLHGADDGEPLGSCMCDPVVTIHANASSNEALATMRRHDVGALPVLYHGFLIGIVTTGDLVRAHVMGEDERPTCTACGSHHHVQASDADPPGSDTHPRPLSLCLICREREAR